MVAKIKPTNFRPLRSAMVIPRCFPWDRYGRDKVHNALANKPFRGFINTNRLTKQSGNHVDSGISIPSRHKGGGKERIDQLAALVGAGIAGLQDTPFRPLLRRPLGLDHATEADGVTGQYRF